LFVEEFKGHWHGHVVLAFASFGHKVLFLNKFLLQRFVQSVLLALETFIRVSSVFTILVNET